MVFATVTLPLILPALGGGWLISFMISLDDVVLASFVSGPGATTLEWTLPSPPPFHQFNTLPVIKADDGH